MDQGGVEFQKLLESGTAFEPEVASKINLFRELVLRESNQQNLTRLLGPKEFFEGHVLDSLALVRSSLVDYPAMDLGSGVGVPGILSALLAPGEWVLAESEGRKADFLSRAVVELGLQDRVKVFSGRAEAYLAEKGEVKSVVARAVGPVERIFGWIRECSTWNSIVLLKGPGWDDEWNEFQKRGRGRQLIAVEGTFEYSLGEENKQRKIVKLNRRGKR